MDIRNKNELRRRIDAFLHEYTHEEYIINEEFCKDTMRMMADFIGHVNGRMDSERKRLTEARRKLKEALWENKVLHEYNYNGSSGICRAKLHDKYPVREDRSVEVGKTYRHFKGKIVEVIAISQDTESPGQYYVVYKCEDGAIWSRPYGMFVGKVDRKKYPDADQEYRFEEVQNGHQK